MPVEFPGSPEIPSRLNCETDPDNERFGNTVFTLTGDTESFFHAEDLTQGAVGISIPIDVIQEGKYDIYFDDETSKDIHITRSADDRRNLSSVNMKGNKYILVIRVSGSSGKRKVAQSAEQLYDDIFHWGNNNLVSGT